MMQRNVPTMEDRLARAEAREARTAGSITPADVQEHLEAFRARTDEIAAELRAREDAVSERENAVTSREQSVSEGEQTVQAKARELDERENSVLARELAANERDERAAIDVRSDEGGGS